MEAFLSIAMLATEEALLRRAAAVAGEPVEQYVLRVALRQAGADVKAKADAQALDPVKKDIIAAYLEVMGLTSAEVLDHARVAKAALAAAKAGRRPEELEMVVRWLRATDSRWRTGKRIPLEEIVGQWAAWAQQAGPVRVVAPAPEAQAEPDDIFGDIVWE